VGVFGFARTGEAVRRRTVFAAEGILTMDSNANGPQKAVDIVNATGIDLLFAVAIVPATVVQSFTRPQRRHFDYRGVIAKDR